MTDRLTDWLTHWLTDGLTDWHQSDWQTNRLTDWLTYWLANWETDWLTDTSLIDWLTNRETDRLTDWLTDRLPNRLTAWLIYAPSSHWRNEWVNLVGHLISLLADLDWYLWIGNGRMAPCRRSTDRRLMDGWGTERPPGDWHASGRRHSPASIHLN